MNTRFLLVLGLLALAATAAQAQTVTLTGRIVDAATEQPLPGATVLAPGTTRGATADREGQFSLGLDEPVRALTVTFLGYQAQTVPVTSTAALVIRLEPSIVDLQPVVVSASRNETPRAEAPVAISALSAADLAATQPNLLSDALSRLPGVLMVDLGNEQHAMSIRQPMSLKALYAYLEDGVPIRPAGLFNHNALIEMNMSGVNRIEVVRGPASATYGSNAVGGAINFLTPTPSVLPEARLALRGSAHGFGRADATASARVGGVGVWAGGYYSRQRDGRREHTDFDKVSFSLRADAPLGSATTLVTTFSTNHLDTDTDGALDSLNYFSQREPNSTAFTSLQTFTYRTVDATRLTTRLNHAWNGRHRSSFAAFARDNSVGQLPHYRIRRSTSNPAVARGEVNEQAFRSLGFDAQHETFLGPLGSRVTVGGTVDYSPSTFVANYIDVERDPATGRFVGFTRRDSLLSDYAVDLVTSGAYAQASVQPARRLTVVGSLRYDHISYGFDNNLTPSAFSGSPDGTDVFSRLSPHLGMTYGFTPAVGMYANASRGFLPPEVSELYSGVSTPTLRPATFNSYETGGWAQLFDRVLQGEASVYLMEGTDEIISVRLPDDSQVNANAGETRHVGVEGALTFAPIRAASLRLSGTVARHTFVRYEEAGVTLDGNRMNQAPESILNAEAAVLPPFLPGSRLALEWQHVGPYYLDVANTDRYEGYDLFNLRGSYRLRGVELWGQMLNLTDILYATTASRGRFGASYTAGAPRTFIVGVAYGL